MELNHRTFAALVLRLAVGGEGNAGSAALRMQHCQNAAADHAIAKCSALNFGQHDLVMCKGLAGNGKSTTVKIVLSIAEKLSGHRRQATASSRNAQSAQ